LHDQDLDTIEELEEELRAVHQKLDEVESRYKDTIGSED
jgi:hypothetical protein